MCLAIPGRVMEIDRGVAPVMGDVSFGGVQKRVCLEWMPEVNVGDYVIVHVGFAISRVDEEEALETIRMFEQMGALGELDEGDRPPAEPPRPADGGASDPGKPGERP